MGGRAGAFTQENAQAGSVGGTVVDEVGGRAPLEGAGEMIEAAIDHFQGEGRHRLVEASGHGVGEVDPHGIQEPGGPQLDQHAVLRAGPRNGQAKQAFDGIEGIFLDSTA